MSALILNSLPTMLAAAFIFCCVWAFLRNFVFPAFLKVIADREQRTLGNEAAAATAKRSAKELEAKISDELTAARLEGIKLRDAILASAKLDAQRHVENVSSRIATQLSRAQLEISERKGAAEHEVPAEAEKLAQLVVERVLSQATGSTGFGQTVH